MKAGSVDQGEVAVECTHCKVRMRAYLGSGGQVRYFRCDKCRRWLSSTYQDVLRADAHFRAHKLDEVPEDPARFAGVKARLERWLAAIEDQDPYRVLGVSPMDRAGDDPEEVPLARPRAAPGPRRLGRADALAQPRLRADPHPPRAGAPGPRGEEADPPRGDRGAAPAVSR